MDFMSDYQERPSVLEANYWYYINLDERGTFAADVRDDGGNTVFEINTDEDPDFFEMGWMKHGKDINGLEEYLQNVGIIKSGDRLDWGQ